MENKVTTEIINNYRKENNLTVEQFCKKCNISKNSYYKFIKSQLSNLSIRVLYNIAVTIKISCDDIIEIDND